GAGGCFCCAACPKIIPTLSVNKSIVIVVFMGSSFVETTTQIRRLVKLRVVPETLVDCRLQMTSTTLGLLHSGRLKISAIDAFRVYGLGSGLAISGRRWAAHGAARHH